MHILLKGQLALLFSLSHRCRNEFSALFLVTTRAIKNTERETDWLNDHVDRIDLICIFQN